MTQGKTFRVGLVGAGYVSEFHIKALRRLPNVRIAGITDLDEARARATAAKFGVGFFSSLKTMAAEGVDVVHVLTPPSAHVPVALDAMALGCHVLVEKPLATSVEDCDRLAAEAAKRGVQLCVNHSLLGDPFVQKAVALVRAGALGQIITVDYLRSSNYPPYRGGPLPPQYREGGYPFRDLGVHALYMMQELLGDIRDVQADFRVSAAKDSDPNIHFDEWRALVRCARGTGNIQLSWNVKPLQHQLIVQGTRGTLRADLFAMYLLRRRNTPAPKAIERIANALGESISSAGQLTWNVALFAAGKIQQYQGLHNFVRSFYEALAAGASMPASAAHARPVVEWTERVAREADHAKEKFCRQYQPTGRPAVVVTGANGQVGRALVQRLIKEDEFVRLFVRRVPPPDVANHPQIEVVLGELGDPAAVDRALANATAVFHLGAAMGGPWEAHEAGTITGTRNVVEACLKHRVPKLVYVSSLSVIDWAGHPPKPVTESSPLEPRPTERGSYTQAKLEAERIVRAAAAERGLPAVILRPGKIWSETGPLIDAAVGIKAGRHLIIIGDGEIRLPLIHVSDVIEGIVKATQSKYAHGEIFQLVDDDLLTRDELAQLYMHSREPGMGDLHVPMNVACWLARALTFALRLLGRVSPLTPYRLHSAYVPLAFDCARAREQLGWRPQVKSASVLRALLKAPPV